VKTKIIYISGGDAFPPAEVKGAMDTIRGMLKLDLDTILFGVPVDTDDIRAGVVSETLEFSGVNANIPEYVAADVAHDAEKVQRVKIEDAAQKSAEIPTISTTPARVRKSRKIKADTVDAGTTESEKTKPTPPILSVIGGIREESIVPEAPAVEPATIAPAPGSPREQSSRGVAQAGVTTTILELDADDAPNGIEPKTSLYDFADADDDATDAEIKSIEDIFEGLSPIAEDRPVNLNQYDEDDAKTERESANAVTADAEIDATLSRLAAEFATAQTKEIGAPAPRSPEGAKGGRIGKLKNILPFKKKDKADGGLMSDLFGWAGIAANDDGGDFEMPEFFRVMN